MGRPSRLAPSLDLRRRRPIRRMRLSRIEDEGKHQKADKESDDEDQLDELSAHPSVRAEALTYGLSCRQRRSPRQGALRLGDSPHN